MNWLGEHGSSVMKVARAYTLTSEECQDLAQEILLQAWKSLPKFEGKASAATWFYRVALHTAMNWHRKDRPRRSRQQPLVEVQALSTEGIDSTVQAQHRDTVEQLYTAINQLPKTDAALVLLYLDELSYQEMSEVLGISESNVGVKLNRAKKALNVLMNGKSHGPDNYQQAWQAHSSQTRVTIDANLLLKEVQRSQRNFRAEIIWGDFAEFGFVLLLLALWFYMGAAHALPWTWYLTVPVLVWYVGFRLIYRRRHQQKPSEPGDPLLQCVKESLSDQENQIWLMRNIFWWDLLPLSISILAFFAHVEWLKQHEYWSDALDALGTVAVVFVVFYFVYLSTQYGVRSKLEP